MKIGKFAAFAVGGSIILLEIAHQEGLIKINWTKLDKSVDRLADKVESSLGREKNWKDKVKTASFRISRSPILFLLIYLQTERFVDNKLDKAESLLTRNSKKAAKWYSKLIGDEEGPKVNDLHIFLASFFGGVALGIATG